MRVCAEPASGSSTANRETKAQLYTHSLINSQTHTFGPDTPRFPYFFAVSDFHGSLRDHGIAHLPLMTAARARARAAHFQNNSAARDPATSGTCAGGPHTVCERSVKGQCAAAEQLF